MSLGNNQRNLDAALPKIGVYICHCGANIAPKVDVEAVAEYAGRLQHVHQAVDYKFMCSHPGQTRIIQDIKEQGVDRVVVASCSPRMHEPTFRRACENAGINPFFFQMANIREQVSWVTSGPDKATAKAKSLVGAAVARVANHLPLYTRSVPVTKSILVVGGGIAGMQAAITAGNAGYQVYLVEREPSIGGHMAKFDKTFPSLDCAACIMTPKMVEVQQHPNIELFTHSELISLEGFVGNFKAGIRVNPRYVDGEKCTGCGTCSQACPVALTNSFDQGLTQRKAIYRSFPQAVPNTFSIEKKDKAPCSVTCPAGINVQGYVQMIARKNYARAMEIIRDKVPMPGVLGRVCPHPCEDQCRRKEVDAPVSICELKRFVSDAHYPNEGAVNIEAEKDARIAVVGSGPAGLAAAYYLRIKGYAVSIYEAADKPGGMLRYGIPDYRLPPGILDREIGTILNSGIQLHTSRSLGKDFSVQDLKDEGFAAIFLAVGAQLPVRIHLEGEDGVDGEIDALTFLKSTNAGKTIPIGKRVVVIGGGNVAIDAARTALRVGAEKVTVLYRRTLDEMPAYPEEIEGAKAEGIHLVLQAVPEKIRSKSKRITGIVYHKTTPGPPDESGRRRPVAIPDSRRLWNCDTVISAIGQNVDTSWADKNPGIEWTRKSTIEVDPNTLQTAIPYVFAGGDAVSGPATVVEALAAGRHAAINIDRHIQGLPLSNVHSQKGDHTHQDWIPIARDIQHVDRQFPKQLTFQRDQANFSEVSLGLQEKQALAEADKCLNCGGCCECMECKDACEVDAVRHDDKAREETKDVGAVILATGFSAFDPSPMEQYGYGIYPEVYTSVEFERINNATGPTSGQILMKNGLPPKRVAIVHCVGSRDERHRRYCSRVCCMYSMKFAHLIREKTQAEVWEFYIDIRSPGKRYEEFYNRVQEEGVHLVRGKVAEITDMVDRPEDEGRLTVVAENTLTRKVLRLPVDMAILSVGLEPAQGAAELGRITGVAGDADGWFNELHVKLAPVQTPKNGLFLAGCCQGPKDIPDTVAQATAAAGEAVALLSKGTVDTRAEIACIDEQLCSGCQTCVAGCAYGAIAFDESIGISRVNDALCQGCGNCASVCPSSAAGVGQFSDRQVMAEIESLLV